MLRAALWTASLLAVGSTICHFFPETWVEPLVLMALGTALLLVSSRGRRGAASREVGSRQSKEAA